MPSQTSLSLPSLQTLAFRLLLHRLHHHLHGPHHHLNCHNRKRVLLKVRPSTDLTKIESMITNLRSLNLSSHLFVVPILRLLSLSASDISFTHLLHSCYPSKSDLNPYSTHPDHLSVGKSHVLPICDDIMAVDWIKAGLTPRPPPRSAMRLTLAKLRERVTAAEVVAATGGAAGLEIGKRAEQLSFGENFSPVPRRI